jgi:hypothetical protein
MIRASKNSASKNSRELYRFFAESGPSLVDFPNKTRPRYLLGPICSGPESTSPVAAKARAAPERTTRMSIEAAGRELRVDLFFHFRVIVPLRKFGGSQLLITGRA